MSESPRVSALRRWWWRAATWQRLLSTTGGTLAALALISAAASLPVLPAASEPNPVAGGIVQPLGTSSEITPSITAPPVAGRTPAWPSRVLTVTKVIDARTITGTDESGAAVTVQVVGTPQPSAEPGCSPSEAARFAEKELLGKKVGLLDLREDPAGRAARIFTAGHEYAGLLSAWQTTCRRGPGSSTTTATPAPTSPPKPTGLSSTDPPPGSTTGPPPHTEQPHYKNCAQVRKAGKAPLRRGEPGFREELDKDGDGVACDR